eukprot:TRINITY_DN13394_c0_g1_i2.p1 TRINITY_DN13394_c0_g1~~TRINITY_DN13394_c0_g1_i2.p1  ORF type:complete len:237 (-),score=21.97 TRINITY_DN13394_c0_g1_i2:483-1193(-)
MAMPSCGLVRNQATFQWWSAPKPPHTPRTPPHTQKNIRLSIDKPADEPLPPPPELGNPSFRKSRRKAVSVHDPSQLAALREMAQRPPQPPPEQQPTEEPSPPQPEHVRPLRARRAAICGIGYAEQAILAQLRMDQAADDRHKQQPSPHVRTRRKAQAACLAPEQLTKYSSMAEELRLEREELCAPPLKPRVRRRRNAVCVGDPVQLAALAGLVQAVDPQYFPLGDLATDSAYASDD